MEEHKLVSNPLIMAKLLYTAAVMMEVATNHWEIEKLSQDAFKVFEKYKYCFED